MNRKYNLQYILNFIQDFGCISETQLKKLFDCNKIDLKDILSSNSVTKKRNIYVHNNRAISNEMIAALDVIVEYIGLYTDFGPGAEPVYITFICDGLIYNIIVTDADTQEGIVKKLNNNPLYFPYADKYILLFKDTNMLDKIKLKKPYLYCIYMPVKIINK